MDCLFCLIAKKEIPAKIIYEDEKAAVFLDIHPRSMGHAVVIPKEHVQTTLELKEDDYRPLLKALVAAEKMIINTLAPHGFTIGINQSKAAGQEVDHLHIHIIPRFSGDGGGSVQGIVSNSPKESIEEIFNKING